MKTVLVIIDGAEASDYEGCQNINYVKQVGDFKLINNTPDGMETNSLTCILNMLGIPTNSIPTGRAYLEALAVNQKINQNDLVFRCNNIKLEDGILVSCGEKSDLEISGDGFRVVNLGGYKNLLIIEESKQYFQSITTYEPHQNLGKKIDNLIPKCSDKRVQKILNDLIFKYSLYPWGQAIKQELPSFYKLHNKKAAAVCSTEIVVGITKAMNMHIAKLNNATADIDTDLFEKAQKTIELIEEYDFVLLHINGADESAHRMNKEEKISFINKIDKVVIKYLLEQITTDTKLIITSDHGTSCCSGKHINKRVSCYIYEEIVNKII
jgi:2,3-bisphosphoglycerate-independent phosphoglycerate mutase